MYMYNVNHRIFVVFASTFAILDVCVQHIALYAYLTTKPFIHESREWQLHVTVDLHSNYIFLRYNYARIKLN